MSDPRIRRIYYLPKSWKADRGSNSISNLHDSLEKEQWENTCDWDEVGRAEWEDLTKSPYVFLSRSPLTFGHSQLVISSDEEAEENEQYFFALASRIIERVILIFTRAFRERKIHENSDYVSLSKLTKTEGAYVKTLILRASASENLGHNGFCGEYKIHLVPFFDSHDKQCSMRFRSLHEIASDQKGGLLGWLGERETTVDKLMELGPFRETLDDFANNNLRMA